MAKWLITGGCGFIGSNLADYLMKQNEDVLVLDNLSRSGSEKNLSWLQNQHKKYFEFLKKDIRQPSEMNEVLKNSKPDFLVHLAGQVAMDISLENPRMDFEINALGTFNMLEGIRAHSPSTMMFFTSSNKVYGSLEHLEYQETTTRYICPDFVHGFSEALPIEGSTPYGCSKLSAEQYVRDYSRVYGIQTVVFRLSSIYGGHQNATFNQGWIGWFCQKALEKSAAPFTICGNGKQVRDILFVDDLCRLFMECAKRRKSEASIYNVGGGEANSLSLLELFLILEEIVKCKMHFQQQAWRTSDQKVFITDYSRIKNDFLWQPSVDKNVGVAKTLEWVKSFSDLYA